MNHFSERQEKHLFFALSLDVVQLLREKMQNVESEIIFAFYLHLGPPMLFSIESSSKGYRF